MAASSAGHRAIVLPSGTEELHAMIDALRAHHNAMHGQVAELAAFLNGVLPAEIERRGGTRQGMLGLDGKLSARIITKPLREVAKLNQEQSKLWVVTYQRYSERVLNIKQMRAANGRFNADA